MTISNSWFSAAFGTSVADLPSRRDGRSATVKQSQVVLLIGDYEEVAPMRLALEAGGIFAVICCNPESAVADGLAADLEVVCYSPSRFANSHSHDQSHDTGDPTGEIAAISRMNQI